MRIFLTDSDRQPDWRRVIATLTAADRVIIRDYAHPDRQQLITDIVTFCRAHPQTPQLSLAGDPQLAQKWGLDIHLPRWASRRQLRDAARRPARVISASAHNDADLLRAARDGVHLVLISPVFNTQSHPDGRPLGITRFAALAYRAQKLGLKPVALGGIHQTNWTLLRPILGHRPDIAAIDGIVSIPSLYI